MKGKFIIGALLMGLLAGCTNNQGINPFIIVGGATPILCWGAVLIDNQSAPIGTKVEIYIGGDMDPSASFIVTTAGKYGAMMVQGDSSRYGQPLHYFINGREATKTGGDEGVFGLSNQVVDISLNTLASKTWDFGSGGYFPRHLPDSFMGSVDLMNLTDPPPAEIQGIYKFEDNWQYPEQGKWLFWAYGAPSCTLSQLVGGKFADYGITTTGACKWEIQLD